MRPNARLVVLCVALTAAAVAQAAPPTEWSSRGVGGGGAFFSPSWSPIDKDELFVSCDMSGEFHTKDLGKSWTVIDFRRFQASPGAVVRFTKDPKALWGLDFSELGGSGVARPVKSADGGVTWATLPENAWPRSQAAYALYVDFDNPDVLLVSAEYRQLFVSTDGGKSFASKFSTQDPGGLHLSGALFDGKSIWAGTNVGVLESTDGGTTFHRMDIGGLATKEYLSSFAGAKQNGKVRFYCVTNSTIWAGVTGAEHSAYKGVYVSDLGDGQWTRRIDGIDAGDQPFYVGAAKGDISTAYLGGGSTGGRPTVYKTADGGASWKIVLDTKQNRNIVTGWAGDGGAFAWSFPEYALGFDVSPADANRVVITDLSCVHATTDGGKSWRQIYTSCAPEHKPGQPVPRNSAYVTTGLEPTSVWGIHWADKDNLFACTTDIRGSRSIDGGKSWSFDYAGHALNTMYHVVQHPKTGKLYAATSSVHDLYESTYLQDARIDRGQGFVLVSSDKGATWQPAHDFHHPVIRLALDPKNTSRLYASVAHGAEGGVYVTDDLDKAGASTWRKLASPPRTEGHAFDIHALGDGSLVATYSGRRDAAKKFTASSGFFVSPDGGKSWEDRSHPDMQYWTKDAVPDARDKSENTWYVSVFNGWGGPAGGKGGLFRTKDRGKTWTRLAGNDLVPYKALNVESCAISPKNPNEMYLTTEYDGLWYTDNLSADKPAFKPVESYPFKHPMRVFFDPWHADQLWVTSFGNGMRVGTMK